MNIVSENSRFAQVDDRGQEIIEKVTANYGVSVKSLTEEIVSVVEAMNVTEAVAAGNWYFDAHSFATELANRHGVSVEIAAGVISAVSPRMPWLRNKNVADAILANFRQYSALSALDAAKEIGMAMSANVAMAVRIARGEAISDALTGVKRRSFYNNIVSPDNGDSVTVDTWMIESFVKVTGLDKKTGEKFVKANDKALNGAGVGYYVIAEAVRSAARYLDMLPSQVQALYWVAMAKNYNGGRTDVQ